MKNKKRPRIKSKKKLVYTTSNQEKSTENKQLHVYTINNKFVGKNDK